VEKGGKKSRERNKPEKVFKDAQPLTKCLSFKAFGRKEKVEGDLEGQEVRGESQSYGEENTFCRRQPGTKVSDRAPKRTCVRKQNGDLF